MPYEIDKLLEAVVVNKGSDLHIRVNAKPMIRVRGVLRGLGTSPLTPEDATALMKSITPEKNQQELEKVGSTDFAIQFGDSARFRCSVFKHQGYVGVAARLIPSTLLSFDAIGLPEVCAELCMRPRGLFLVTGPTGSGKTTTLASMINYINEQRSDHIITIEDPIEYVHQHKKCIITQRELGADVPSFKEALRRALRMDPDIILVGEMRDLETIESAVTAAETGHLVFGTLHTTTAARTVNRLIDAFPTTQQEQIRAQLSVGLIAVLCQQLLPTADKKGRIAAFELMVSTPSIQNLIRENETFKIDSFIQTSAKDGMILLDDHLFNLFQVGQIAEEDMFARCNREDALSEKVALWKNKQLKQRNG